MITIDSWTFAWEKTCSFLQLFQNGNYEKQIEDYDMDLDTEVTIKCLYTMFVRFIEFPIDK